MTCLFLTIELGNWQISRAHEKEELLAILEKAKKAQPLKLDNSWGGDSLSDVFKIPAFACDSTTKSRYIRVFGVFDKSLTVFIDNRTHKGVAGFHVVTPLKNAHGSVLVLRGWVPQNPSNRNKIPEIATPTQAIALEGLCENDFPQTLQLKSGELPALGDNTYNKIFQNLDRASFFRWSGLVVEPWIFRQVSDVMQVPKEEDPPLPQSEANVPSNASSEGISAGKTKAAIPDGLIRDWNIVTLGASRHIAYAVQWYSLAVLTVVLWLRFFSAKIFRFFRNFFMTV